MRLIQQFHDFQAGLKMFHVTLIRRHLRFNRRLEDGYVESTLQNNIWFWDFYKAEDWDRNTKTPKSGTSPTTPFDFNEICTDMRREDNTVTFSVMITETERAGIYSLIFANEIDAKIFTGEAFQDFQ